MSHILFPIGGSSTKVSAVKQKPTELPRQLFYVIRGVTDAIEALQLYLELTAESSYTSDETVRNTLGYLAFDGHVGDTACQLRAGMLLDITTHLRAPGSFETVTAMYRTVGKLKGVLASARKLIGNLLALDWNKIRLGALDELSIPKAGITMDELFARLGWAGVDETTLGYDNRSASSCESLVSQDCLSSLSSSLSDFDGCLLTDLPPSTKSKASNIGSNEKAERWDPSNNQQLARLIVYSYVLSKYKRLTAFGGEYRVTLRPEIAFGVGQKLMEQEFGAQFVRPNKRAIGEEFLSLQRYVSDLSCAWLEFQARRSWSLHPGYHGLLKSTVRRSAKGVNSTSSYVGYLVLRSVWAEKSTPIIIMTTRFCPTGIHRNYFSANLVHKSHNTVENLGLPVVPDISWQLKRLLGKDLSELRKCLEPHIMISGNSIDGNTSDYHGRLPSAYIHDEERCCDNEEHCNNMLTTSQDRIVQAIFAEHRHYAFELTGSEALLDQESVVQPLMETTLPGLSTLWQASKKEAASLGTGSSMKLYMWQHVALESPARFLARVEAFNRPWIIDMSV